MQGDSELLLDALLWRTLDNFERGDVETMEADSAEYLSRLDGHHSGLHRYMAALMLCMQESCHGNFANADALSLRAAELGAQQREPSARSFYVVRQLFRWLDGRVECSEGCELDPPADLPAPYHALWLLAWLRSGRERQTRNALAVARARGFENIPLNPLRRPTLAVYTQCACELDELECAAELYQALLEHDGLQILLQPGVPLGPTAYFLGMLAAKLGDTSSATAHFEAALRACRALRSRSGLWRVQQAYARMSIQHADWQRAAALLEQARGLADELDCEPWQKQTLELTRELQKQPTRLTQVAG